MRMLRFDPAKRPRAARTIGAGVVTNPAALALLAVFYRLEPDDQDCIIDAAAGLLRAQRRATERREAQQKGGA